MANFGTDLSSEDNWTTQEPHADDDDADGTDALNKSVKVIKINEGQ